MPLSPRKITPEAVLEILLLVSRNRYRWTSNKMNMTVTAVHLSGLAARDF